MSARRLMFAAACALAVNASAYAQEVADQAASQAPSGPLAPLISLIVTGGPLMYVLAGLAVLAIAAIVVKVVQFLWLGVGFNGFAAEMIDLIRQDRDDDATAALAKKRSPVAKVMEAAIRGKDNMKMNDMLVREEVTRVAQAQLDSLERGLSLLGLIATIAPLVGLLGTVLGMIEAFQQMEGVGDRVEPAILAGGIWQALLTTAVGLSVAIPVAIAYTWLQRSVDVEAARMEDAATQVFTADLFDAVDATAGEGVVAEKAAA